MAKNTWAADLKAIARQILANQNKLNPQKTAEFTHDDLMRDGLPTHERRIDDALVLKDVPTAPPIDLLGKTEVGVEGGIDNGLLAILESSDETPSSTGIPSTHVRADLEEIEIPPTIVKEPSEIPATIVSAPPTIAREISDGLFEYEKELPLFNSPKMDWDNDHDAAIKSALEAIASPYFQIESPDGFDVAALEEALEVF